MILERSSNSSIELSHFSAQAHSQHEHPAGILNFLLKFSDPFLGRIETVVMSGRGRGSSKAPTLSAPPVTSHHFHGPLGEQHACLLTPFINAFPIFTLMGFGAQTGVRATDAYTRLHIFALDVSFIMGKWDGKHMLLFSVPFSAKFFNKERKWLDFVIGKRISLFFITWE